ncbi:MAG TPA: VOC family protein [Flavisolibacter sp.]|nr:VOC family protein [Flavisolibacter sp.]
MKVSVIIFISLFGIFGCMVHKKKAQINHIAFSVLDLAKSRSFYQDVIGLDTIPEPFKVGRHAWFAIGDKSQLHLIQNPPPLVVPNKNTHICFSVPDINDFIAVLKKHNIHFEDWPGTASAITTRADGIHQIYLQDPDGYWIEINDDHD